MLWFTTAIRTYQRLSLRTYFQRHIFNFHIWWIKYVNPIWLIIYCCWVLTICLTQHKAWKIMCFLPLGVSDKKRQWLLPPPPTPPPPPHSCFLTQIIIIIQGLESVISNLPPNLSSKFCWSLPLSYCQVGKK